MSKKVNYMNIQEFREKGFLQEANRQFFHPLGLALEVGIDKSGDEFISGVWDYRDDPEGMSYWMKDIEQAEKKMKYVQELFDSKAELRTQLFGDPVQSVEQMKR